MKIIKLLTWLKTCEITCEIDMTKFIKIISIVFGIYFHFLIHNHMYHFGINIFQPIVIYTYRKIIFFQISNVVLLVSIARRI
jgi:hypothetical protein